MPIGTRGWAKCGITKPDLYSKDDSLNIFSFSTEERKNTKTLSRALFRPNATLYAIKHHIFFVTLSLYSNSFLIFFHFDHNYFWFRSATLVLTVQNFYLFPSPCLFVYFVAFLACFIIISSFLGPRSPAAPLCPGSEYRYPRRTSSNPRATTEGLDI